MAAQLGGREGYEPIGRLPPFASSCYRTQQRVRRSHAAVTAAPAEQAMDLAERHSMHRYLTQPQRVILQISSVHMGDGIAGTVPESDHGRAWHV